MLDENYEAKGIKIAVGLFIVVVMVGAIALLLTHKQEDTRRSYVIEIASSGANMKGAVRGFIEGMKSYGYEEGQNVSYIVHSGKISAEEALDAMAKKNVDLIFTLTTPITKKAKALTSESQLPVVFIMHDPVASGVIDSLVRPGGNLTGVQVRGGTPKALEWLQIIMPQVKRVFVPLGQETMASVQSLQDLQEVSQQLGVSIVSKKILTREELEVALTEMPGDIDAIFMLHSVLIRANVDVLMKIAIERKMPVVSTHHNQEATITFGLNGYSAGVQVSRLAHQILQGGQPADLPTEQVDYHLGINLTNAQNIGLPISDEILLQADAIVR